MARRSLSLRHRRASFIRDFSTVRSLPDSDDANEHNVTPADVVRFEQAIGRKTSWVYFSDNWFESRAFPEATCKWIRSLGKVPYVRLMLRSDLDQGHAEKLFSLANICAGRFDDDLRRWAEQRADFPRPDPDRMGNGAKRRMVCLEWKVEWWRGGARASTSRPTATSWT